MVFFPTFLDPDFCWHRFPGLLQGGSQVAPVARTDPSWNKMRNPSARSEGTVLFHALWLNHSRIIHRHSNPLFNPLEINYSYIYQSIWSQLCQQSDNPKVSHPHWQYFHQGSRDDATRRSLNRKHRAHGICIALPACFLALAVEEPKIDWWSTHFQTRSHKMPQVYFSFFPAAMWICLKMGYTPNYSHLIGIMISKTIGKMGYTIFRHTAMWKIHENSRIHPLLQVTP